jgi:hypothetical protein
MDIDLVAVAVVQQTHRAARLYLTATAMMIMMTVMTIYSRYAQL